MKSFFVNTVINTLKCINLYASYSHTIYIGLPFKKNTCDNLLWVHILIIRKKLKEENKLIKLKTPWYYEDKTKNEFKMVDNVMILKENGTREDIQKWTGKNIESIFIHCHK